MLFYCPALLNVYALLVQIKLERQSRDGNFRQERAMPPAGNRSCDVIDHVTI